MGPWFLAGALLLASLLAPLPVWAQATAQPDTVVERQEVLLPTLGVLELTRELRQQLGLFPEVEDFRVARLFLQEDGRPILEIESLRDGRLIRERRALAGAELEELRDQLAARMEEAPAREPLQPVMGQEARGGLVLGQTLLGMAYTGWAVPVALDIDSAQGAVAAYLLTAGVSFLVPYQWTRTRPATRVHRDLSMYGGTRGIGVGILAGDALADRDGDRGTRLRLGMGVAGSWTGSILGYAAAQRWTPDEGTAALWSAMGDLGFASGALLAYTAGPYAQETVLVQDGNVTYEDERTRNPSLGHAITLAGGGAGLATGAWMGRRYAMTEGNVTVLRSAGILGAQVGAAAGRMATDEGRPIAGGILAGGLGATALSVPFLQRRHFTEGEGLLVAAGHLGGGLSALGITYLVMEDIDDHPATYLATSALGSILGAGLVFRALDPGSAPSPRSRSGGSGQASASRGPELSGVSLFTQPDGRTHLGLTVRF
jgi:hypothetical protein